MDQNPINITELFYQNGLLTDIIANSSIKINEPLKSVTIKDAIIFLKSSHGKVLLSVWVVNSHRVSAAQNGWAYEPPIAKLSTSCNTENLVMRPQHPNQPGSWPWSSWSWTTKKNLFRNKSRSRIVWGGLDQLISNSGLTMYCGACKRWYSHQKHVYIKMELV